MSIENENIIYISLGIRSLTVKIRKGNHLWKPQENPIAKRHESDWSIRVEKISGVNSLDIFQFDVFLKFFICFKNINLYPNKKFKQFLNFHFKTQIISVYLKMSNFSEIFFQALYKPSDGSLKSPSHQFIIFFFSRYPRIRNCPQGSSPELFQTKGSPLEAIGWNFDEMLQMVKREPNLEKSALPFPFCHLYLWNHWVSSGIQYPGILQNIDKTRRSGPKQIGETEFGRIWKW